MQSFLVDSDVCFDKEKASESTSKLCIYLLTFVSVCFMSVEGQQAREHEKSKKKLCQAPGKAMENRGKLCQAPGKAIEH